MSLFSTPGSPNSVKLQREEKPLWTDTSRSPVSSRALKVLRLGHDTVPHASALPGWPWHSRSSSQIHGFPLPGGGPRGSNYQDAPGDPTPAEADLGRTFMDPSGRRSPTPRSSGLSGFGTLTDGTGTCHLDRSAAATGTGPAPKGDNGDGGAPRRRMTGSTWSHAAAAIFTALERLPTAFHLLPARPALFRLCWGGVAGGGIGAGVGSSGSSHPREVRLFGDSAAPPSRCCHARCEALGDTAQASFCPDLVTLVR